MYLYIQCASFGVSLHDGGFVWTWSHRTLWSFMAPAAHSSVCLLCAIKPFVEESNFFRELNSSRLWRNSFVLLTLRAGAVQMSGRGSHGAMKIHAREREHKSIFPCKVWNFSADVSRCLAQEMVISCPSVLSPPPMSLYQHLVFGAAGKQVSFISQGFPVPPLLVLLA